MKLRLRTQEVELCTVGDASVPISRAGLCGPPHACRRAGSAGFAAALFVQSMVTSANQPGMAMLDAGYKAFATDADVPRTVDGAPEGASYFFFGDEQRGLKLPQGAKALLGARL